MVIIIIKILELFSIKSAEIYTESIRNLFR